ncbi:cation diffusion facilitator family transporter [Schleiferilactobacillus harbinensis]|uniref:cation diffusion facilitator family transporter n=1 Tax=Schleiferilactobacillus harbinensis TaxID=304207 RepID=UPI00345E9E64
MMFNTSNSLHMSKNLTDRSRASVQRARKVLALNLLVYISISAAEMIIGQRAHSTALLADGQNNVTGIISVIALIVGLTFSIKPSDAYHLEGHWQFENLAVFLSGLIMFLVGLACAWDGVTKVIALVTRHYTGQVQGIAAVMAAISAGTMLTLSGVNHLLGRKTQSASLAASARDFFSDSLTSTGTMLAILIASLCHVYWVDPVAAIILGGFIIYNGSRILSGSAEKLSNGFSPDIRQAITTTIQAAEDVQTVTFVDGRYSGSNIIVAAEIVLPARTSLPDAYRICQHVQLLLQIQFPILYCCIQVKPALAEKGLHP